MTILLTGGGSGGHITPILAVASEIKKIQPSARVVYIGQKGDSLADVPSSHPAIDEVLLVSAGKFRRYHGEGWRQIFDIPTQVKNLRDAFRVVMGIWQSFLIMQRLHPSVVFTRGGFVSVPVALSAKLSGVPYITHDSDSTPSLANRIIARWAAFHAVALPSELYPYAKHKTRMVGVPVAHDFQVVDDKSQQEFRREIGLEQYKYILLVTGGGNGAEGLNSLVAQSMSLLLTRYPKLAIIHISGRAWEDKLKQQYAAILDSHFQKQVIVKGFVTDLYKYSGAADIIIARGGATGLAEFAQQHKACIVIPAPQLAWQSHHAKVLAQQDAIELLNEKDSDVSQKLAATVSRLLDNKLYRENLMANLGKLGQPDAAHQLAMLLLEQAKHK